MTMRRPRFSHSLRTRLILWNALILATLFGILGIILLDAIRIGLLASVDQEIMMKTERIMMNGLEKGDTGPSPTPWNPHHPCLINLNGQIFAQSQRLVAWDRNAYRLALKQQVVYSTVIVNNEPIRILSRLFPHGEEKLGVIQVPQTLLPVHGAIDRGQQTLWRLLPIVLLCAGLGGAYLTGRLLRTVQHIAQTAEEIGAQDLSRRLEVRGEDEFARLSETFNGMLERLNASFAQQDRLLEQQKRFTADASHDLQTPLSVIKANASLMLSMDATREDCLMALREIEETSDSMSQLVKDLLMLARADEGRLGQQRSLLSVQEVLQQAIARVSHRHSAPIRLLPGAEGLTVEASEEELIRLFMNLLDNAQRYTPEDGEITVSARYGGENLLITFCDTGVGIAPEHLPHLGERFYRADASRTRSEGGTGLGLSICRSIAEAHGGSLTIESTLGVGTTVTVAFPAATSEKGAYQA
jgi:two-component system, OmpR family, sensor kinase